MSGDFWKLIPVQKHYEIVPKTLGLKHFLAISRLGPSPNPFKQHHTRALDMLRPEALEATPYDGFEDAPTHAIPYEDFVRGAFRSPLINTRRWFWEWAASKQLK